MLSRRQGRLSRFRKNKRRLRERLRQRIFFRDRMMPEAMDKPRVVVLTGAGISAESGIRTFRAADGLWEEHRVEDVATPEGFARDPELVQAFYNARRRQLQQPEIAPNPAHLALAKLEEALGDRFLLVTQNIDNLHERAGNKNIIHMHGELLKVRCAWSGQVLDWKEDVLPEDKCHCCQFPARLRPHVVWFGEMPLGMDDIYSALAMADVFIAIGTSGHVYPAAGFVHEARLHGAHTVELNLEPSQVGSEFAEKHYGLASEVVPAFIDKLLQENAYREVIWRQRVNEAARAVMLAYAAGNDLDQIGGNYNVERLVITPADDTTFPPTPAVMESDTDYRLRIQQAFEGLSTAGSTGAYQFHGRSADGRVADISVISPEPACVTVSVLSRENNGVASDELLAIVRTALNDEDVRPVADRVTVQSAKIVDYKITASLYLYPGPESEPVLSAAKAKLQAYITAQHRLGRDIRKSAIYAALHVEGVQRVELAAPVADIVLDDTQASWCSEYSVTIGGNDE